VNWQRYIRPDIAASVVVHLTIVGLLILSAGVHPFGAVPTEPIMVELVTPAEAERKQEPVPAPKLPPSDASAPAPPEPPQATVPPPTPPQPAPPPRPAPQKQPPPSPEKPPQLAQHDAAAPQPQASPSPSLGYTPPEPDLTVKYHVMLGLPAGRPAPSASGDKPGDGIDATASTAANVSSSLIAEFRRHLKTCSKLPVSVAQSDDVMVKLRVLMASDGTLAAEPILIEATASEKGPLLMRSAITALQTCQPYAMLPRDRYPEWKVIDLTFTPQDFVG
jgi:outer membrane biosynthesis protein TonB